jgi:hypothetical protein
MQVDRRLPIGQRYGDVVNHSLTANTGQFGFWRVSAHLRVLITGAVKIYLSLIVNTYLSHSVVNNSWALVNQ